MPAVDSQWPEMIASAVRTLNEPKLDLVRHGVTCEGDVSSDGRPVGLGDAVAARIASEVAGEFRSGNDLTGGSTESVFPLGWEVSERVTRALHDRDRKGVGCR